MIAADIFLKIDTALGSSINLMYPLIKTIILPVFVAGVLLYTAVKAYNILVTDSDIYRTLAIDLGRLFICSMVIGTADYYGSLVVPVFTGAADDIVGVLTGGVSIGSTIDNLIDKFINVVQHLFENSLSIWDDWILIIIQLLTLLIYGVLAIILLGVAITTIAAAKLLLALVLVVGPIFICFAFFPSTKNWFSQWVGLCLNYIFVSILFPVAFMLLLSIIEDFIFPPAMTDLDGMFHLEHVISTAIVLFAGYKISGMIPSVASSLTGGLGMSSIGDITNRNGSQRKSKSSSKDSPEPKKDGMLKKGVQAAWGKLNRKGSVEA
ncbi:type IV secretion system protein [Thaumasiovibrio subtropicus]|uniref:type IV secretion system protein n=1 Tax=Thaumasiovibrio subtropicus TaxID=1891207 RepID=UPI000B353219|nr:type IV secretion system protein [Thaumasiovibrio subtropicus]